MNITKEQAAKDRLIKAVPYFRAGLAKAQAKGVAEFAILAKEPNGNKSIELECFAEDFLNDIATLIGLPEQTKTHDMNAKALGFMQKHGLSK